MSEFCLRERTAHCDWRRWSEQATAGRVPARESRVQGVEMAAGHGGGGPVTLAAGVLCFLLKAQEGHGQVLKERVGGEPGAILSFVD